MAPIDRHYMKPSSRLSIWGVLAILMLAGIVGLAASTYRRWEGQPPEVKFDRDFKALGRNPELQLSVMDSGTGLKRVTVHLKQSDNDVVLVDEAPDDTASRTYDLGKLITEKYQMTEGPATLTVTAVDHAFRNFLRGNETEITRNFDVDKTPPMLEVFSGQHYINQGGSECIVYRVSSDVESSGVQVGPHFFPGYPVHPEDPTVRFALFAFAYNLPADTTAQAVARDAAGNETKVEFPQKVFVRRFRSRDITIDDDFLRKVVPEILAHTTGIQDSGEMVRVFVDINRNLRKKNHETLAELSKDSPGEFLWNSAFQQLSNSQVESFFADHRSYFYEGQQIDQEDHVGFDLSVVKHYPIEAANDGKVLLAEYFGIYGNTVIIDHGAGLVSLYGHMSSLDVKAGEMVKKKQILGKSGETGLAGGDHLHFGMFLDGVPVDPTEWWDAKWIQDHVLDRLHAVS